MNIIKILASVSRPFLISGSKLTVVTTLQVIYMKIKCDIILINAVSPIDDIFSHLAFNDFTTRLLFHYCNLAMYSACCQLFDCREKCLRMRLFFSFPGKYRHNIVGNEMD